MLKLFHFIFVSIVDFVTPPPAPDCEPLEYRNHTFISDLYSMLACWIGQDFMEALSLFLSYKIFVLKCGIWSTTDPWTRFFQGQASPCSRKMKRNHSFSKGKSLLTQTMGGPYQQKTGTNIFIKQTKKPKQQLVFPQACSFLGNESSQKAIIIFTLLERLSAVGSFSFTRAN